MRNFFSNQIKTAFYFSGILFLALAVLILFTGNKALFLWINANLTPSFGQIARGFSLLGEFGWMLLLLVLSFKQGFSKTLTVGLGWLIGACFSWLFKLWLMAGAARPFEYFSSQTHTHLNVVTGVPLLHFNTFPSGHTLTAFTAAILSLFLFPNQPKWVGFMVITLAFLCGLSRIVLVQHWPVDVLGGMGFGILAAFLSEQILFQFSKDKV